MAVKSDFSRGTRDRVDGQEDAHVTQRELASPPDLRPRSTARQIRSRPGEADDRATRKR